MNHREQLAHIEKLMQRSSRFISLSGLSGVGAGITALIGAFIAKQSIDAHHIPSSFYGDPKKMTVLVDTQLIFDLGVIALSVLILSSVIAFYYSHRRARNCGATLFDQSAMRLLGAFFPSMLVGGLFFLKLEYVISIFLFDLIASIISPRNSEPESLMLCSN